MHPFRSTLAALALLAAAAGQSNPSQTGIRLGEETLKQFKVGEATEEWLVSVVGPPTTRTDRADGISILRYTTEEKSTGIVSWFTGSSARTTATIYFIVRSGIVTQFWADREEQNKLLGGKTEKDTGEKKS